MLFITLILGLLVGYLIGKHRGIAEAERAIETIVSMGYTLKEP